jgi:hypothetical protein
VKLKDLLHKIVKSTRTDWHGISCGRSASGPSYKNQLQFYENYIGRNRYVTVDGGRAYFRFRRAKMSWKSQVRNMSSSDCWTQSFTAATGSLKTIFSVHILKLWRKSGRDSSQAHTLHLPRCLEASAVLVKPCDMDGSGKRTAWVTNSTYGCRTR